MKPILTMKPYTIFYATNWCNYPRTGTLALWLDDMQSLLLAMQTN